MKNFFDKIGSAFFISSFIPSLGFLMIATFIFDPIIPAALRQRLQATFEPLDQAGILLIISAILLGYTLTSLKEFHYRLFQGYYWPFNLSLLRKRQKNRASKLRKKLGILKEQVDESIKHNSKCIDSLQDEYYRLEAQYQRNYPSELDKVLPTSFGNIMRAAEYYPAERYGIDKTVIWPRLLEVIPESYHNKIEQSDNSLTFIINCAILSIAMAILCIKASIYQVIFLYLAKNGQSNLVYFIPVQAGTKAERIYIERTGLYLVGSMIAIGIAAILCYISVQVAKSYGNMVCSAFDMFRFELLGRFKQEIPTDSDTEYDLWKKISEFISIGESAGPLPFEYNISVNEKKNLSDKSTSERGKGLLGFFTRIF
jgi:hypothetical protein